MNPSASAYVPSIAVVSALARREVVTSPPPLTPVLQNAAALSPTPALFITNPTELKSIPPQQQPQLTAADRLRRLRERDRSAPLIGISHATEEPVPSTSPLRSTWEVRGGSLGSCNGGGDHEAAPQIIQYSKQRLLSLQPAALELVARGRIVDAPPYLKIPESFARLLTLPFALEYLNVGAASDLVQHRPCTNPLFATSSLGSGRVEHDEKLLRNYHCLICSMGDEQPCFAVRQVLQRTTKHILSSRLSAALLQPPEVVWGLTQILLVFEAKQSSLRLRLLAERFPLVRHKVEEYLCGEGYHLPLPSVTAHEEWRRVNEILKFDAIRDNRTRIITDLSKHWKRRSTQFEQFVHFFSLRTARPVRQVKNMITHAVKSGMVAMLTGDLTALFLLHRLGFFVPPDYYWTVFPFLQQALGEGTLTHDVVRHVGAYLSSRQPADMYNPIERPRTSKK